MPINSVFSAGRVGDIEINGLVEAQAQLTRTAAAVDPSKGIRAVMALAAGMVHRHLMLLGKDTPPVGITGVLPVITGRLKNSFFFGTERQGDTLVGYVATNLVYAPDVERRRGFLRKTRDDMERPVTDLFASYIRGVIR